MKLKKLLKDINVQAVRGSKEIEITGLCANSKYVAPGNLFIAKKGLTHDGAKFIPEAIAAGAVAVLTDFYDPFFPQVVQIIHPDINAIEAQLAANYYGCPGDSLFLVGITGTNGKTTCSYLVKHLFDGLGHFCGLIGTIEWIVGKNTLPSTLTTPDVITNNKLFHEMIMSHCSSAVMEVSSHALDQERAKEIEFDVAVFTNLTQDHLDYHQTMQQYAEAKAKLFSSLRKGKKNHEKTAVVNADSPYLPILLKDCNAKVITYGIENKADLFASNINLSPQGISFEANYLGQKATVTSSLIGRFNVYNCLASMAVALSRGAPLEKIAELLRTFKTAPGRLERVPNKANLNIFVDYAHTDDALQNVLQTLQEFKKGKLICVFGCGGNRDKTKRPKMGSVAESFADMPIVTTDNPRSEEPEAIIRQIMQGFKNPTKALIELDRSDAIHRAVSLAGIDDIILIAGKGHEHYQIFAHKTIDFDDRRVARMACEQKNLTLIP